MSELPRHPYVPNRQYSKGDRGLLSLQDKKLVFVSAPVPHADYLRDHLGYRNTRFAYPANPSPWLSLDILQEPPLLNRIVEYAGPARAVQLVAYATTPQFLLLVRALRNDWGLTVLLPESPLPGCEWIKEYIDTKAGYRSLAARWLSDAEALMPEGMACETMLQAAEAAHWFCARGKPCVIKTDGGESGMGQHIIRPEADPSVEAVFQELQADPYLHHDLIIVEEYIDSVNHFSPSLEVYVPPMGDGEPRITYLSNQLFLGLSDFYGLLINKEQLQSKWYPALAESGLTIARKLQAMGYAGHFDIDTVVDDNDRVYLLELNSRRTAGTHVHEFASHFFGDNYLDEVALLSINKMKTGPISRFEDLQAAIGDLLYPIAGQKRGIIFAVTSILAASEFGCIIVAASAAEALDLHQQLRDRFQPTVH
ncbi:MAG TPA: hypothetical protein VI547_04310 [Anaerolineales bacterium]|nr:hypothetical protein [Anaerolineales bacterium]